MGIQHMHVPTMQTVSIPPIAHILSGEWAQLLFIKDSLIHSTEAVDESCPSMY